MSTRRAFGRAVLGGLASLAFSFVAHAQHPLTQQQPMMLQQGPQQATLDILVLHATNQPGPGSIAPSIANMPQLKRPPFSAYNTYTQLARQSMTLVKGMPTNYTLINGRIVQITLTNVLPGPRYEISAAINQPGGGPYINLLRVTSPPNDTFFVAGQQYQGGVLVIGFTLH
ncbi:MAG TPA: hypothetical protein VH054_00045 [Polyangiaceae bacterium]|nr:hypothetical protein [Polyangiaceae bacterium]